MVEIATKNSNWICCDQWESQQKAFVDFPQVSSKLIEKLRKVYCPKYIKNARRLNIYYVCNLDHAYKCKLLNGRLKNIGVNTLVVRRPNAKFNHIKLKSDYKKGVVVVDIPPVSYDRSSTKVRELLNGHKWKELEKYLDKAVIQYLKGNPDDILQTIQF